MMFHGHQKFSLDELKKANKNERVCKRCGKATQVLVHTTFYCPPCEYELSGELTPQQKIDKKAKDKQDRELRQFGDRDDEITRKANFAVDPDGTIHKVSKK